METKQIPAPLLEEISRRADNYSERYSQLDSGVKGASEGYSAAGKYWVGRLLAENEAAQKALNQLREAAGVFMLKQKFGGNLTEFRNDLTVALWEADKVLNSIIKVNDGNKKAEKKTNALPFYIAAIDEESGNYLPKPLPASRLKEAIDNGHLCHTTEADAQKQCDNLNSL